MTRLPLTDDAATASTPLSLADAARSLEILDGALSTMASTTAVAADRLLEPESEHPPAGETQAAAWWLRRVVESALAARATCRAARLAIGPRKPASGERDGRADAPTAEMLTASCSAGRSGRDRWIVVGYDGSDPARRALARAAHAAGERGTVVVVTTEPRLHATAPDAGPLIEAQDDPSRLLADAKDLVAARATVAGVVTVARTGDPAEELLDTARSVGADLIVVGRRGKNFVARTLLGSVADRVVGQAPCDVLVVA